MKKIIVDLDVVTVANYPRNESAADYGRKEYAKRFLDYVADGVRDGKFWLVSLRSFDALLALWKYREIVIKILDFYHSNSSELVDTTEIVAEFIEKGIDYDEVIKSFTDKGIKGEDVLIILVASIRHATIVTFNRKDLRNRQEEIRRLLAANGLDSVEITEPSELFKDSEGGISA